MTNEGAQVQLLDLNKQLPISNLAGDQWSPLRSFCLLCERGTRGWDESRPYDGIRRFQFVILNGVKDPAQHYITVTQDPSSFHFSGWQLGERCAFAAGRPFDTRHTDCMDVKLGGRPMVALTILLFVVRTRNTRAGYIPLLRRRRYWRDTCGRGMAPPLHYCVTGGKYRQASRGNCICPGGLRLYPKQKNPPPSP